MGTLYAWRKKYGGMEVSDLRRLKRLEEENRNLKRMYANQALQLEMAKDVISNANANNKLDRMYWTLRELRLINSIIQPKLTKRKNTRKTIK